MGKLLTSQAVIDRKPLFGDMSLATFAVYLDLLCRVLEYTEPREAYDGKTPQKGATTIDEIHHSRWEAWASMETMANACCLKGKDAIRPHLEKLRRLGAIHTVELEGRDAPTQRIVNRWAARHQLDQVRRAFRVAMVGSGISSEVVEKAVEEQLAELRDQLTGAHPKGYLPTEFKLAAELRAVYEREFPHLVQAERDRLEAARAQQEAARAQQEAVWQAQVTKAAATVDPAFDAAIGANVGRSVPMPAELRARVAGGVPVGASVW